MSKYTEDALKELQAYFQSAEVPNRIELGPGTIVTDTKKLINSHLLNIEKNVGKPIAIPFFDRLYRIKEIVEQPSS
jgi:hypothetical protein